MLASLPPNAASVPQSDAGALLRHWRTTRRMSQLDLALRAEVSSRHLSYVENGRARPSRELVVRLADALEIPLRARNALLVAAGYAPIYRETGLVAPEMAQVQRAVDFILKQQEPFPALVLDRHWNVLMSNDGARRLLVFLLGDEPEENNMLRLLFHPRWLRPLVTNWDEVAENLVRRFEHEVALVPPDERSKALLAEVLGYPGVPAHLHTRNPDTPAGPLLTIGFCKQHVQLRLFSTFTTFGTPRNVTLDELRIECAFPADDATARFCRGLAAGTALLSRAAAGV